MQDSETNGDSAVIPALFLGHGSPMNAIEENEFVKGFRDVSATLPKPKKILCISAHWETTGTRITAMEKPRTIHDFGGFPAALYEIQYPAPGDPLFAEHVIDLTRKSAVLPDHSWGLDHGAWSVIKHLYPDASGPVVQLSLDRNRSAREHYDLAKELAHLRREGVLIIGSGNMVHNLRLVAWDKMNDHFGYDWALDAGRKMKEAISSRNHSALIDYPSMGDSIRLAVPTPEHYLPLLYILALQGEKEKVEFFNDKPVAGSLTMTSILVRD